MELNFIKDNNKYVSEFEVSSDFNLHIERNEGGTLYIQQRTGNGQYDTVKDAVFKLGDSVIDYDFQALVYPKYIKIVSDINPIAYITSDGEVTEIKSQTKEVEVTANGTTQVAPDAGYSYLTGVTVKTNVPQSGGDAPSQPSGGNMEYWDVTAAPGGASEVSPFLLLLKYTKNESQYIQSIVSIRSTGVTPIAVALDRSVKVVNSEGQVLTVGEYFQQMGFSDFSAAGWVQITEEEFYTI